MAGILPRYRYLLGAEEALFGAASPTHIFFLAASEIPAYQEYYPLDAQRFTLLPPWLDNPESFPAPRNEIRAQLAAESGLPSEGPIALFVGSDFKRKGLDRAIRAIATMSSSRLHLVVCGKYDPSEYRALASRSGLDGRVHFLGPRNDIPRWMAAADLLIHPARQETAGMVLLEALTYGLPVVCTAQCGYAKHVAAAGGHVLPEDPAPEDIASAITGTLEYQSPLRSRALAWASDPARGQTADLILEPMRGSLA